MALNPFVPKPLTNESVMGNQQIINENIALLQAWIQVNLGISIVSMVDGITELSNQNKEIEKSIDGLANEVIIG